MGSAIILDLAMIVGGLVAAGGSAGGGIAATVESRGLGVVPAWGAAAAGVTAGVEIAGVGVIDLGRRIIVILDAYPRLMQMSSAGALGAAREERVAQILGGTRSGEVIRDPRFGRTDIDVVSASGDLVSVGGPGKAMNPMNFERGLRALQAEAHRRGVQALAFIVRGTPQVVIDAAQRVLGYEYVFVF